MAGRRTAAADGPESARSAGTPASARLRVPRPALERRLDEALTRRLTVVTANAGFGKSTLLASWAEGRRSCWYTVTTEDVALGTLARGLVDALRLRVPSLPSAIDTAVRGWRGPDGGAEELARAAAFGAAICTALGQRVRRDLVLVLDDLEEIGDSPAPARLVEALCRHAPPVLHLVISSRADLPFPIDRLRGAGQVLELTASDLALAREETEALVAAALGGEQPELAARLHAAVGGWPAATQLTLETLRAVPPTEREDALARLPRPGGPLYSYLAAEVFAREPESVRTLVRVTAPLEEFSVELCEELGVADAASALASLARRGLFVEPQPHAPGWFTLNPLVREFAATHLPVDDAELRSILLRAGLHHAAAGRIEPALRALAAAGDGPALAAFLQAHGEAALEAGAADAVAAAVELLPPELRDATGERLLGQALQMRGDWDAALVAYDRAAAGLPAVPASVAWRMGLIHHLRGRIDEALAAYGSARLDGSEPADEAILLAWSASASWLRADADACREQARRAFAAASVSGDPRALAAAHTALALLAALEGDRAANDTHYLRALEYAARGGDMLQTIRIRANRGSHHIEEGDYEEALQELDLAIELADLGGFAALRALALSNRGEVKFRTGELDEAIADLEAARELYQRAGSRMVAYPLGKLGELYRERGDLALARAACEEALAIAEEAQDVQGLIPALMALARALADDDPDAAAPLARRAVEFGPTIDHAQALLAEGWVALARGDAAAAGDAAEQAAEAARTRRDTPALAEALELAGAAGDRTAGAARLDQAIELWRDIGNPLGLAWAELGLAAVSEGAAAREAAERATSGFRGIGARRGAAAAARLLAELDRRSRPLVEVRTLGTFVVLREGEPVPLAEWQSKKARDLLKLLVARRGRPVPRELLMETLWPEDDPARLAGRLSVALATVRSVLDPARRHGREHFVVGDTGAVRLDLAEVDVDVERFLATAGTALASRREQEIEVAAERLALAEEAYTGDFLEEDAYEDWAAPLREEARAAYVEVARTLAEDARDRGDTAAATRFFLRVLERDPYDESAHLGLVATLAAAGRHGEAHRFYRSYCARLAELGLEAAAFPGQAGAP